MTISRNFDAIKYIMSILIIAAEQISTFGTNILYFLAINCYTNLIL